MTASILDSAVIVGASVDWLSMSTHEPRGQVALLEWRDARFAALELEGQREKQWAAHGYSYRQRGSVAVGVGRRDYVAQISGGEAAASWRDCAGWATNVSRLDLALTARPAGASSALAGQAYRDAETVQRRRGRRTALTLISAQDRGDTLYVGSRKSDMLGRLYNKEKESGEKAYEGCWRWEVQYRREYASQAMRSLQVSPSPSESIAGTVRRWFVDRGVNVPSGACGHELDSRLPAKESDDERWLKWARRCVAPRAKELAARYGWRYVAESLVGHIRTLEEWESLVHGVEIELVGVE